MKYTYYHAVQELRELEKFGYPRMPRFITMGPRYKAINNLYFKLLSCNKRPKQFSIQQLMEMPVVGLVEIEFRFRYSPNTRDLWIYRLTVTHYPENERLQIYIREKNKIPTFNDLTELFETSYCNKQKFVIKGTLSLAATIEEELYRIIQDKILTKEF